MRTIDNFGRELSETAVEIFTQLTPSSTWTVSHNKGRNIVATPFDSDWKELICEEDQTSVYQALFKHQSMRTGFVVYI